MLFGAPSILQSDNGSEFTAEVIQELKVVWPRLVMVHGKPRHPQSQGSVERANSDIKDMLVAWMDDNQTTDWSLGIKFVQFQKNSSFHAGIQRSPYTAMFGCEAKVGLTTSSLLVEIIDKMQSEDDLLSLLSRNTEGVSNQQSTSINNLTPEQTSHSVAEVVSETAVDNNLTPENTSASQRDIMPEISEQNGVANILTPEDVTNPEPHNQTIDYDDGTDLSLKLNTTESDDAEEGSHEEHDRSDNDTQRSSGEAAIPNNLLSTRMKIIL